MSDRAWTEGRIDTRRRNPIDEILATRPPETSPSTHAPTPAATRYGEGDGRRLQQEREEIRETYPAMDIRLPSGELRGVFYYDLSGGPHLDPHHTTLTIPFRRETLVVRGYRLLQVYRSILHHSLDILQVTHRAEFDENGDDPVIASIEVITRESRH